MKNITSKKILNAMKKKFEISIKLNQIIQKEQQKCKHKNVIEGNYSSYAPPFRVCTNCGYAEEGWGCGYSFLQPKLLKVPELPRDEAMKYVTNRIIKNDVHFDVKIGRKSIDFLF